MTEVIDDGETFKSYRTGDVVETTVEFLDTDTNSLIPKGTLDRVESVSSDHHGGLQLNLVNHGRGWSNHVWRRKKSIRATICIECLNKTRNVPGAVFELGVGTGETTIILAQWLKANELTKPLYAFDSFERLKPGHFDGPLSPLDVEKCSPEHLWSRAMAVGVDNINLVEGKIENTLLPILQYISPSFVFIDLDVYDSTCFAVRSLMKNMPIGGILAFHDWKLPQTPGIAKVIDEELDSSYKCLNPETDEDTICFEKME